MSKSKDETKRERILQAAARVFARKGYGASKISDIARESEVADGTIYLYYKNKEDLVQAVYDHHADQMIGPMRQALQDGKNPLERLRVFVETHRNLLAEHSEIAEGIFSVTQTGKRREYLDLLQQIVLDGQREGYLRPDLQPLTVERIVLGSVSMTNGQLTSLEELRQIYLVLVSGVANTQGATRPQSSGRSASMSVA